MKSCLITAISQPLLGFLALKNPCSASWHAAASVAGSRKSYRRTLPQDGWSCEIFQSAENLPETWDEIAAEDNLFLSQLYLNAIERYAPEGMKFAYLVFYFRDAPVGVACCQSLTFHAAEHIQTAAEPGLNIGQWVKQRVAASTSVPLLICGNMLLTGDHAFYFDPAYADEPQSARLLEAATDLLCNGKVIPGFEASATLFKDFESHHNCFTSRLREEGFHEIPFQPNMRMVLRPEWLCFEDYLEAMSSKYRVRARRAFRKLDGLERRELDLATIQALDPQLHALYRSVALHANFNMIHLHPQYFSGLKSALRDRFRLWGYFHGSELVGFHSAIYNGDELEAHFLGFQHGHNAHFQLYLNMLYDIVREAFTAGVHHIVFSRTATEIKSSIGAEACETYCYLRHCNPVLNTVTQALVGYMTPKEAWTPRHPFKEEELAAEV